MLKAENKINPGGDTMKIFGTWFMAPIKFEKMDYDVMAEIRVYADAIKLGDTIAVEYNEDLDRFEGMGRTLIKVAHKIPTRTKTKKIQWLWAERDVYLSDLVAMIHNQDEQAKVSSTELPENYIVGVIK